jgi:hypothetical protein
MLNLFQHRLSAAPAGNSNPESVGRNMGFVMAGGQVWMIRIDEDQIRIKAGNTARGSHSYDVPGARK